MRAGLRAAAVLLAAGSAFQAWTLLSTEIGAIAGTKLSELTICLILHLTTSTPRDEV